MKKTTLRQNVTNKDRQWYVVDASEYPLGKVSVAAANALRGKTRPDYTPHADGGDYVVILNAEKVNVSGNKETGKAYFRHSGYTGNLKTQTLAEVREKTPKRILQEAISGMLPKNKLRAAQLKRLKLVIGQENPHHGEKLIPLKIQ